MQVGEAAGHVSFACPGHLRYPGATPPPHRGLPMKYGFNLLLWTTHVTPDQFQLFDKLKAAGYDGVELPLFEGDSAHYESVRKALDDNGLKCTAVTVVGPEANPIAAEA